MYNSVKTSNAKLASTITDISDIDVNRIFVSGTNKNGSKEKIEQIMYNLQSVGVLSGHEYGDYI